METIYDDVLIHYGVKGMKWGVRKDRRPKGTRTRSSGSTEDEKRASRNRKIRNVAIAAGALTVAAGAAYVTTKLGRSNPKLKEIAFDRAKQSAQTTLNNAFQPPTSIIHASRGKNKGFQFMQKGGTPDYMEVYDAGFGGNSSNPDFFKKIDGMIAARFMDPQGRKDRSGRIIPQEVIIPASMTDGINSTQDVISKIWPLIKDQYDYT